MNRNQTRVVLVLFAVIAVLTAILLVNTRANASVIEQPDRTVERVEVRYAEPVPTDRFPNRHYFELNDGSTYRYGTYGQCARDNATPNRICRTVFWYAR